MSISIPTKTRLLVQLVKSWEPKTKTDFSTCFGAWQDDRDAEEIVLEIYKARRNNPEIEEL